MSKTHTNKLFFFKDLDDHYIIYLFGIRICLKHKSKFVYREAKEYGITNQKRNPQLIVSLTTYPARINTVHKTINTLLTQSLQPDRIILWLGNSQFPQKDKQLPENLIKLKKLGLEIRYCEDLKSYKKLIPTLKNFPDDIIVTVDDDVYYENDMLESLYNAYINNPKNIYVKRAVKLELQNNNIKNISSRKYLYQHNIEPTYLNQPMGGSGCLYPPHSLNENITNTELIKTTLPTHDDVYFWSMAVLNKTKIQVVDGFDKNLYFVEGTQDVGLIHTNKANAEGITLENAYKLMINKFPQILQNILEECTDKTESNQKKISVIMPVYNTPSQYLKESIESILNQTYKNFEFIIIDDGSTIKEVKETINSYKDPRIKYYYKDNSGIANTLNFGISKASGEYIARMDSDDIAIATRFEKQIAFFKKNPDISICGSWYRVFPQNKTVKMIPHPRYLDFIKKCCIGHPTVMFRKSDFDKYNLKYDENFLCEDYELWSRAVRYLRFANIQEVLLLYRLSQHNISQIKHEEIIKHSRLVKENMLNFLKQDSNSQNKIISILIKKLYYKSFCTSFLSLRNTNEHHKILTILGIKIKFTKNLFQKKG